MTTKQLNSENHLNSVAGWPPDAGHVRGAGERLPINVLAIVGAGLLAYSAVIHFHLWDSEGYRHIPTIGPLFLMQAIVGFVLSVATAIFRKLLLVVAATGFAISSIGGLLISIWWGLFGWQESFSAPNVVVALSVEAAAAALLGTASLLLALPWLSRLRSHGPGEA
jgi:hypothetical protein